MNLVTSIGGRSKENLRLPVRLPPLFELLLLSYRWAEVDISLCTLIANPPGPDLSGFLKKISGEQVLWRGLTTAGYTQFGRAAGGNYDPVCFDWRSRKKTRDCKIVRIDHEEILCNDRVRVLCEIAPSFEELILKTIAEAEKSKPMQKSKTAVS
jgi:hypothetical protein